jgi:hypothetical protein
MSHPSAYKAVTAQGGTVGCPSVRGWHTLEVCITSLHCRGSWRCPLCSRGLGVRLCVVWCGVCGYSTNVLWVLCVSALRLLKLLLLMAAPPPAPEWGVVMKMAPCPFTTTHSGVKWR